MLDGGVGVAVPHRCVEVAGAAGIEPTTLGLEDLGSPRPTVRIQSVTVGEPTPQSGKSRSFGREYAPLYAPLVQVADVLYLASRVCTVFGSEWTQVGPKFFTSRLLRELHSHTAGPNSISSVDTRVLELPII